MSVTYQRNTVVSTTTSVCEPLHGVELVIDFVNTLDLEEGTDALSSTGALASWLVERGLLDTSARPPRDRLASSSDGAARFPVR